MVLLKIAEAMVLAKPLRALGHCGARGARGDDCRGQEREACMTLSSHLKVLAS